MHTKRRRLLLILAALVLVVLAVLVGVFAGAKYFVGQESAVRTAWRVDVGELLGEDQELELELRHLAIGIDNIRMALDCDVILGGLLTEYLAPYMQQLQEYARAYNIFGDSADYIHLSSLRQHSVSLGAALHFIQNFISEY